MIRRASILALLLAAATIARGADTPFGALMAASWESIFLQPTALWVPGEFGHADLIGGIAPTNTATLPTLTDHGWSFNGTNQFADVGRPANLEPRTNDYSMAVWVKPNTVHVAGLMGKGFAGAGDRWMLTLQTGNKFETMFAPDTATVYVPAVGNYTTNAWQMIAMTAKLNGTNRTMNTYCGGTNAATGSAANYIVTFDGNVNVPFRIGCYANSAGVPNTFYNGYIRAAAVWDRTLSATEIAEIWERTR